MLFLEALSQVRDERAQDYELLQLCREAARAATPRCARRAWPRKPTASPVVLKAVLRAVSIAWGDFGDSVSSPGKLAIVVLFVLSWCFFPSTRGCALFPPEMPIEGASHVVVLAHDAQAAGHAAAGFRRRISRALRCGAAARG